MGSASVVGRAWSANAFDPGIPYAYKKRQVHQVQGFLEVSISSRLRRSLTNDGVNYFAQRRRLARLAEGKQGSWRWIMRDFDALMRYVLRLIINDVLSRTDQLPEWDYSRKSIKFCYNQKILQLRYFHVISTTDSAVQCYLSYWSCLKHNYLHLLITLKMFNAQTYKQMHLQKQHRTNNLIGRNPYLDKHFYLFYHGDFKGSFLPCLQSHFDGECV